VNFKVDVPAPQGGPQSGQYPTPPRRKTHVGAKKKRTAKEHAASPRSLAGAEAWANGLTLVLRVQFV
jgi:hypothetical protein